MFANGAVIWLSKKQQTVALSTTEGECIALRSAAQAAIWLQQLLADIEYAISEPTVVYEDNQGAITLTKSPVSHARTKHIDIRHHFI